MCANFILPCGENHYGFFLRCPTSFYNQPKNYISGYYKNQKYAFDPKNDPYNSDYDWTEEVDEEEMKREIPKEMYMALDGEVLESPNWEEGIPTALSEIMDKLCDALDE